MAAMAAASATQAATRIPRSMAVTKALCAVRASSVPSGPPTRRLRMSAAAIEPVAVCAALPGTCAVASALASRDRYAAAERLPMIAMPRAPPTSLMVSLTALPAPAWWPGTVAMMVVLAGAITSPMPAPMIATARASAG